MCPDGFPSKRAVTSVTDLRTCPNVACECTVGKETEPTCTPVLEIYDNDDCGGEPSATYGSDDCVHDLDANDHVRVSVVAQAPACTAAFVAPDGDVDEQVQFTVCCA